MQLQYSPDRAESHCSSQSALYHCRQKPETSRSFAILPDDFGLSHKNHLVRMTRQCTDHIVNGGLTKKLYHNHYFFPLHPYFSCVIALKYTIFSIPYILIAGHFFILYFIKKSYLNSTFFINIVSLIIFTLLILSVVRWNFPQSFRKKFFIISYFPYFSTAFP